MQDLRRRVLLIPDTTCWVLGTIARETARRWARRFEFRAVSSAFLRRYPRQLEPAVAWADIVDCIDARRLEDATCACLSKRAFVARVHHVEDWQEEYAAIGRPATEGGPDCIVTACSQVCSTVADKATDPDRVCRLPYGVDAGAFRPPGPKQTVSARRSLRLPRDAFVLGSFGKSRELSDRKGLDVFLDALEMLREATQRVFVLSTGPKPTEFFTRLEGAGIAFRQDPFVLSQADLVQRYRALDAYVVASRTEGGPVPLLEAMSCGLPVVTTPVGMAPDCVADGQNGLVVPRDDSRAMAEAVGRLMDSALLRRKLGAAARATAETRLAWERSLRDVPAVYERAIESCGRRRLGDACARSERWRGPDERAAMAFDHYEFGLMLIRSGHVSAARRLACQAMWRWPLQRWSRTLLASAFGDGKWLRPIWRGLGPLRGALLPRAGRGKEER